MVGPCPPDSVPASIVSLAEEGRLPFSFLERRRYRYPTPPPRPPAPPSQSSQTISSAPLPALSPSPESAQPSCEARRQTLTRSQPAERPRSPRGTTAPARYPREDPRGARGGVRYRTYRRVSWTLSRGERTNGRGDESGRSSEVLAREISERRCERG